jgi:hypothetical protein
MQRRQWRSRLLTWLTWLLAGCILAVSLVSWRLLTWLSRRLIQVLLLQRCS